MKAYLILVHIPSKMECNLINIYLFYKTLCRKTTYLITSTFLFPVVWVSKYTEHEGREYDLPFPNFLTDFNQSSYVRIDNLLYFQALPVSSID
jgi:hypothetical protein